MSLQDKYVELVTLFTEHNLTRGQFLDALYNKFGSFQIQVHEQNGFCSKRYDWLDARERPFFQEKANHRTPCDCEIVFDIDIPAWLNQEERLQILKMVLRRLEEHHQIKPMCFDTGKGFHLHWFDTNLAKMLVKEPVNKVRDKYVSAILKDVHCDMMMTRGNNTIQIEGVEHWKRSCIVKPIYCSF